MKSTNKLAQIWFEDFVQRLNGESDADCRTRRLNAFDWDVSADRLPTIAPHELPRESLVQ